MFRTGLIAVALMLAAGTASAQYYPPRDYPPQDYSPRDYPPRDYPPPGYGRPDYPPPGYGRGYDGPPPRRAFGSRCEAAIPTGYGARPLICSIVRDRPLGRPCVCPAPPRFGGGSFEGRVIP